MPSVMPAPALRAWNVRSLDDRVRVLRNLVWGRIVGPDGRPDPTGSLRDPRMRQIGLLVTRRCPPRNDLCELGAVFEFVVTNVRYTGDIAGKDTFQSALRTLQYGGGDCLPGDTLLLVENRGLVPLRHVEPGWRIWGLERWSRVEKVWSKGVLPVDLAVLETGASFRATADHHVYVADCPEHVGCACPLAARTLRRAALSEVKIGDSFPVPPLVRQYIGDARLHRDTVRVVGVEKNVDRVETFDITTDDHRVYLPEAHVTVSNCDDMAVLNAVLAMENGFYTKFRITSNTGATWDHIYTMAGVPKHKPTRYVALDTTLGPGKFGREPGRAKYRDFDVGAGES